ncbi:MAG: nuclear transport factor 2 family protein [Thermoleophilaceae bacterium]|nr:nuclear transport factor 2 family protein [Thermoleophilaceae bacterium]
MPLDHLDLARRGFETINSGDLDGLLELVADDIVADVPTGYANADTYRGRDGFRRMAEQWLEPWSSFHAEPLGFIEEGDAVVVPIRQTATGRESGIEVEMELAYLMRVRDGKLIQWRLCRDTDEALEFARNTPVFDPGAPSG